MIILKIKDKGLFLEIPGIPATRSPVEIDISKLNINTIITFLRKNGIQNFEIISNNDHSIQNTNVNVIKKTSFDKEFSKLEEITNILSEKEKDVDYSNLEQNTTKTKKIKQDNKKDKNPKIEELDISKIVTKTKNIKIPSIKNTTTDFDNSSDLLSRMMDREDV